MNKANVLLPVTVFTCMEIAAAVTLTESQVQWKTYSHTVNPDYSLRNDTFSTDIVTRTYKSFVMENEYLKVTLVPDYGGRILSMIYKPTGHEQLYQNPVGRPYGPEWDAFYYDWLMLWGGIFPTFPEPEHGKAWCRPWAYEITRNTAEEVSVKMTFTDDIDFNTPAAQFRYGTTHITCNFEVTLAAQTSALKTSVTLVNPNGGETPYEYWTNVGVAPGSAPGNTRCDDQTEIIGPVSNVKISGDWPDIRKVEQNVQGDIYRFEHLRWYKNWVNDGIAYAWPVESNFWGALNHNNNEAILRISDNVKTPGLKLWGFGYNQSRGFNPETSTEYRRPFIEMWAGASREFFTPAQFPANSTLQFDEYYTPAVGLVSFTHASEHAVIDLATDKASYNGGSDRDAVVSCRYVVTKPADRVTLILQFKGGGNAVTVHEKTGDHDAGGPFEIQETVAVQDLCDDIDRLVFELRSDAQTLMSAEVPVSFSNAGSCAASSRARRRRPIRSRAGAPVSRKVYTINGAYIGEAGERNARLLSKTGIFLSVDKQGRCTRVVGFVP
ncbi:MAG: DUF5107 domain-containing protein [Chitinispirillaceae bacterium]|nr:DUF5107 domain-containing protein [Chitinispirillaceae bacterium]